MAAVGELWVSWFGCCVQQPQKRRHRIDRYKTNNKSDYKLEEKKGEDFFFV